MEGGDRVPGSGAEKDVKPSYWVDACEDIIINDLVDFDHSIVPGAVENGGSNQVDLGLESDFFGGIDHILDSIKNGAGLPLAPEETIAVGGGAIVAGEEAGEISKGKEDMATNGQSDGGGKDCHNGSAHNRKQHGASNGSGVENGDGKLLNGKGVEMLDNSSNINGNGVYRNDNRGDLGSRNRDRDVDNEERLSRKRPYGRDDIDTRDREHLRRREHYNSSGRRDGRDRDWKDKEPRGYWEREKLGSNEMVFRVGSWEVDRNKEAKTVTDRNKDCTGAPEKKPEQPEEKLPEEQARQYQLDVLEQAKKKKVLTATLR